VPGYEADDLAAAVVKTCTDRQIYLLTIDTDWMQLINEYTTWVCVKGFHPPIRSLETLPVWFQAKLDKESKKVQNQLNSSNPKDIVKWKMLTGDSSDNLPKGTPQHMFDLLEPRPEHRLWDTLDIPSIVAARQLEVNIDNGALRDDWILSNEGHLPTPVYGQG
jgi:5'-3' exonuclease